MCIYNLIESNQEFYIFELIKMDLIKVIINFLKIDTDINMIDITLDIFN